MMQQPRNIATRFIVLCLTIIAIACFIPKYSQASHVFQEEVVLESEPKITITFDDVSLSAALRTLRKEYGISLAYDSKQLKRYQVKTSFENATVDQVIEALLAPFDLSFEKVQQTYVLFEKVDDPEPKSKPLSRTNFDLSGRVLDAETLEPLPFATIREANESIGSISNYEGYFTLEYVSSDTTMISVKYLGYAELIVKLVPSELKELNTYYLFPIRAYLPVATIESAQEKSLEDMGETETIALSMRTINQLANAGENDAVRALQLLPGVSSTTENSSELFVRGADSDETLFLYDGFTVYHTDHFFGIFSAFNTQGIKHIQLHKGTLDSKFGGGSSVVEITGRNGNLLRTNKRLDVNLMSVSFMAETPLSNEKSSLLVAVRRSFSDVLFSPLYQGLFNNLYDRSIAGVDEADADAFQSNAPDFSFYDAHVKFSIEASKKDRLYLSFYNGRDQLGIQYNDSTTDDRFKVQYNDESRWGNFGASGKWNRQWNAHEYSEAIVGFSSFRSDLFGFDVQNNIAIGITDTSFFDRNNLLEDFTAQWDHHLKVDGHSLELGAQFKNYFINGVSFNADGTENRFTEDEELSSIYVQDQIDITRSLNLRVGARFQLFSATNTMYVDPRARLKWSPRESMLLHAGFGRTHQFIRRTRRQNLFLNTPDVWAIAGNGDVPVMRSDQVSGGLRLKKGKFILDATAYWIQKWGTLQDTRTLGAVPQGIYNDDLLVGSGESMGLEFLLRAEGKTHSGWLSYTIGESVNSFDEPGFEEIYTNYDQRHEFTSVYLYRRGIFQFNAIWVYGSGRPFTDVLGTYDLELINGTNNEWVIFGDLNAARLDAYHRLDLSVSFQTSWRGTDLEFGASVYNVYNRSNPRERQFFVQGNTNEGLDVGMKELSYLGVTPTINLAISW